MTGDTIEPKTKKLKVDDAILETETIRRNIGSKGKWRHVRSALGNVITLLGWCSFNIVALKARMRRMDETLEELERKPPHEQVAAIAIKQTDHGERLLILQEDVDRFHSTAKHNKTEFDKSVERATRLEWRIDEIEKTIERLQADSFQFGNVFDHVTAKAQIVKAQSLGMALVEEIPDWLEKLLRRMTTLTNAEPDDEEVRLLSSVAHFAKRIEHRQSLIEQGWRNAESGGSNA